MKRRILLLGSLIFTILIVIAGIYSYKHWYVPQENLKHGFVIVSTFDCPVGYEIKAHLGSMIYHLPGDPYYDRTNAANGYCFDNANDAQQQGFRESYR